MHAYTFTKYGKPQEVLSITQLSMPPVGDDDVFIKIKYFSINDYDWGAVTGNPRIYQLMYGLISPKKKYQIPGMELSGEILAIGKNVNKFKVGDFVFGDISDYGFGTYASHICIHQDAVIKLPNGLDMIHAASLSHASMLAWQAMQPISSIKPGMEVLVNGAGGGVGNFAMQLATRCDAVITGVDSSQKFEHLQRLGCNHLINYKESDFTKLGKQYDLIIDCKSTKGPLAYAKVLKPGGRYVTVGGKINSLLKIALRSLLPQAEKKSITILALKANKGMDDFLKFLPPSEILFAIEGPFPFEDSARQMQRFGEGKHIGKVIIEAPN